jgi:hypothetical protein
VVNPRDDEVKAFKTLGLSGSVTSSTMYPL